MEFHEIANVLPRFDQDRLQEMADDILANGQRHPIVLFEGKILDGRHRFLACEIANVEPKVVYFKGGWEDAVALVVSENLVRRNLTGSQRALAWGKLAQLGEGRPIKWTADGENPDTLPGSGGQKLRRATEFSAAQAAKQAQVGTRSIERAKKVLADGVPELAKAVQDGDLGVFPAGYLAELPKEQQKEALAAGPEAVKEAVREAKTKNKTRNVLKKVQQPVQQPAGGVRPISRMCIDLMAAAELIGTVVIALNHTSQPPSDTQRLSAMRLLERIETHVVSVRSLLSPVSDDELKSWVGDGQSPEGSGG
jgi:ParB-like chromosome segregation protein Spo0J